MANEGEDQQISPEAPIDTTSDIKQTQGQPKENLPTETPTADPEVASEEALPSSPTAKALDHPKPTRDTHEESLSRKRDREGSVEPSSAPSTVKSPSDVLPAKKNRLLGSGSDVAEKVTDDEPPVAAASEDSASASKVVSGDNEKVGQIRQRVEELSYDERETKRADLGAKRRSPDPEYPSGDRSGTSEKTLEKDQKVSSPLPTASTADTSPRKQPTFSSFSASSSPFASSSASAGVSGPSWLAGSSGAASSYSSPGPVLFGSGKSNRTLGAMSGTTGAIKASALGGGSPAPDHADSTSTPSPASSSGISKSQTSTIATSAPSSTKPSSALGFGAFAASRAFVGGSKAASSTPQAAFGSSVSSKKAEEGQAADSPTAGESIFDQQQPTQVGAGSANDPSTDDTVSGEGGGGGKARIRRVPSGELATGEEHERTVHSVRAKLYTMSKDGVDGTAADGTWKERGTGTLRVNVSKDMRYLTQGFGARLVMRAEGVFRLILNVSLFRGMKVELAQEKFVRIVAVERDKLIHFAIKVSNPSAAYELFRAIKHHIPAAATTAPAANNGPINDRHDASIPPALPPRTTGKAPTTAFVFHKDDQGEEEDATGEEAA